MKHKAVQQPIIYPDSDGRPMADNTVQFYWIQKLHGGLDHLFSGDPMVFVASDLLWYPVKGKPGICKAPDVMIAWGRPKGHRGSYKQWEENGIAPRFVIEVLSDSNNDREMATKLAFYQKYGVEEYVIIDSYLNKLEVWTQDKSGNFIQESEPVLHWKSTLTGIRFEVSEDEMQVYSPKGSPFITHAETYMLLEKHKKLVEELKRSTQAERLAKEAALAEIARLKAELEKQKKEKDQ